MKTLFKISLVLIFTLQVTIAQTPPKIEMDEKHTIYKENFTTNENTTLVLNLNNTTAQVIESPDNNVYIEYTKEFKNTRKKRIKTQLELIIVSGKKEGNKITYSTKSRSGIHDRIYRFEELMIGRLEKKKFLKDSIQKPVERKSLDSILYEIKESESIYRNKLLGSVKIKPHVKKWKKSDQIIITKMIIKIPKNIHVRATLENSNLVFMDDFYNRATMNARNSKLRFKSLGNSLNIFDFDNGYFNSEVVSGGNYSFANVKEVRIGHLSNSLLNTEFTKVELGEVGRNNKIVDFNSKYFLYNFSINCENLNMNTEYSEVNLFIPEDKNFYLETFGHDTVHRLPKNVSTETTSIRKSEFHKMFIAGKETASKKVYIKSVHGIIRLGEDSIDFSN